MSKNKLFKVMMILVLMFPLAIPAVAQEGTQEATEDVVGTVDGVVDDVVDAPEVIDVIETPDTVESPVIVVSNDDYNFIGVIVVTIAFVVMQLVNGFTNGRYLQTFEATVRQYFINNQPLKDQLEKRASQLPEKQRRYINAMIDVLDPHLEFGFTDLDDDIKTELRDIFDGVVEPVGDGVINHILE